MIQPFIPACPRPVTARGTTRARGLSWLGKESAVLPNRKTGLFSLSAADLKKVTTFFREAVFSLVNPEAQGGGILRAFWNLP
jgi:hypothetical protein